MKNIIILSFVSLLFASCGNSSNDELSTDIINNPGIEEGAKKELPIFEFEKEVEDFGTITQGVNQGATIYHSGEAAEDSFLTGFRFHQNRPKKDFKDPSQISNKRK